MKFRVIGTIRFLRLPAFRITPAALREARRLNCRKCVQGAADKGIISYEFDLRYDPTVIQPLPVPVDITGTVSIGLVALVNAKEPGLLRVVVYGPLPIDENGVLLNLRFTAVGKAGSVSPLSFERMMFNEGEPLVSVSDGHVELF